MPEGSKTGRCRETPNLKREAARPYEYGAESKSLAYDEAVSLKLLWAAVANDQ